MRERRFSTDRTRRLWDAYAAKYDRQIGFWERRLFEGGREWVCSQARGNTLEIGAGTGRNLAHYPPDVRLTAVELSERMLEIARARAAKVRPGADLRSGDAQALDFPDESFDSVVVTLALCSIPDDAQAISEVKRILRPGGRFLALEHVAGSSPVVRGAQRAVEALTFRWTGDHQTREPLVRLEAGGFEIEEVQRLKWGIVQRIRARKPVATSGGPVARHTDRIRPQG